MDDQIIEFLQQSNYIESVSDSQSLDDAVEAWKFIVSCNQLNEERILQTHKLLMIHKSIAEKDKGAWRTEVVMVGGTEKKPWYAITALIDSWILNANDVVINKVKRDSSSFLAEIIKGHHITFETIHPFIDGNGRVGRILMNWQRIKVNLPILIIREEEKREYYQWFK